MVLQANSVLKLVLPSIYISVHQYVCSTDYDQQCSPVVYSNWYSSHCIFQYISMCVVLTMISSAVFLQASSVLKLVLLTLYISVHQYVCCTDYDQQCSPVVYSNWYSSHCIFQYISMCVVLTMISSAVFLQASSVLKLVLLTFITSVYLVVVQVTHRVLFDNRDFLLYAYDEYVF